MRKETGEKIAPKIIHEEGEFLIVNKPSGWITNSASTTKDQPVLQKWLEENVKSEISGNERLRSGIVHRLDKETSGLLIIAKTEKSFYALQAQFKERTVKKKYIALLHGELKEPEGKVEVEVGRLPWNRERFGVLAGGRPSLTRYKLEKVYGDKEKYSLVHFFPETGRTHQIRTHAKYLGNPIVSDTFYAGRKTARKDREWCPRLFLHAAKISFNHPVTHKKVTFVSLLPIDLKKALS